MSVATPVSCGAFALSGASSLLGLAVLALSSGSWLALLFLVAAAADFVFGYRIYRIALPAKEPPT